MRNFYNWMSEKIQEVIQQDEFGSENTSGKRELVVLVGPPAVGKSTYIARKFNPDEVIVINRDSIVDDIATENGLTYDEMFINPSADSNLGDEHPKYGKVILAPEWMKWTRFVYEKIFNANNDVNRRLEEKFRRSVETNKNIVVDMTNMNTSSRMNSLKYVEDRDFFKRAVVFQMSDSDMPELLNRMRRRAQQIKDAGGSKTIGEDVISRMIASFQKVSPEEGFDKVETLNSFTAGQT